MTSGQNYKFGMDISKEWMKKDYLKKISIECLQEEGK
jgi:hypothetical protein